LPNKFPLLPVRDLIVFPRMVVPLVVSRPKRVKALEEAMGGAHVVFIASQKIEDIEDPGEGDIYSVGTTAKILELLKMPNGQLKILVEGQSRGKLLNLRPVLAKGYVEADVEVIEELVDKTPEVQALMRQAAQLFEQYIKLNRRVSIETAASVNAIDEPARLADVIAGNLLIKMSDKHLLLEMLNPEERLSRIVEILHSEIEILNLERRIHNRVRTQIEKTQKEYYLNEQMKAIQKELRQKDDSSKEMDELREKIKTAQMPQEAAEAAEKEIARLEKMMPYSPESTVIRTYLDWMLALPWAARSADQLELSHAKKILDEDHFGLEKVKERIVEYLAVLKLVKTMKGPILCFVGPPGVGKTSMGRSIARAMGREFAKMSLGGVRDESEIRGHRRTYIGSLPGRLIQSIRKAKTKNPVLLLDEIDKMGTDWRGDPAAALLEVLDPEQNKAFMDHFLDVGFDLSEVFFICTANTLFNIPASLQDRLEIIRFSGYTEEEKLHIAENHLLPKQLKEHGMDPVDVKIPKETIRRIIRDYTREAGVRSLERWIATLCRKTAKTFAEESVEKPYIITEKISRRLLGVPEFSREHATANDIGVSTGLAWTEHGGETLAIEVAKMPGKGKLILTGKLGEVMQESAHAALSFIRANAKKWRIKDSFCEPATTTSNFHASVWRSCPPKPEMASTTRTAGVAATISP